MGEPVPHPFGFGRLGAAIVAPACWLWALHLATGMFDRFFALENTKRVQLLATLDAVSRTLLVGPLGTPIAVVLMIAIGFLPLVYLAMTAARKRGSV